MSARTATWAAWSVCAATLALISVAVVFYAVNRTLDLDQIFLVTVVASALAGGLVSSRRPRNPVGWIFLGSALCFALQESTTQYAIYGLRTEPGSLPAPAAFAWPPNWLWVPGFTLVFVFFPLYFPDGRLVSRRWRPAVLFSAGVTAATAAAFAFLLPEANDSLAAFEIANPLLIEAPRATAPTITGVLTALVFVSVIASAASLIVRFRRSRGVERQQIKWVAFAAAASPAVGLVAILAQTLAPVLYPPLDVAEEIVGAGVPVAVGIAVLKYRLYDVDRIINRTLVYGALTAMLILVYFGGVAIMQAVFRLLTGQEQQPQLAVVASTLAIAALFNPLRRRIQGFIDRRFYRQRYDAGETLARFGSRLREETDLDRLGGDLVGVVRETMQPVHASLWLREPGEKPRADDPKTIPRNFLSDRVP